MSVERVLTGFIVLFGLAAIFWVIPLQVETVDAGRIIPSTVPTIALTILLVAAAVQFFTSKVSIQINVPVFVRATFYIIAMIVAVALMERLGFEYVAPILALFVMLLIGERRWYWLLLGGVIIPIGVWMIVEQVLGRTLA